MLLHVFFVYFWFWVKHDLVWDSLRPCISLSSTATDLCVILWGQKRYLIIGQHSPQWETQSGRVQFPRITNGARIINHWQKTAATWNTFRHVTRCCRSSWEIPQHSDMRMCECILPQMELIRAVGLKLSTKSDIRLPNSWKEEWRTTNNQPTPALQQSAYIRSLKECVTQCDSAPSGYSFLISVTAKYAGSRQALRSSMYSTTFTQEN